MSKCCIVSFAFCYSIHCPGLHIDVTNSRYHTTRFFYETSDFNQLSKKIKIQHLPAAPSLIPDLDIKSICVQCFLGYTESNVDWPRARFWH